MGSHETSKSWRARRQLYWSRAVGTLDSVPTWAVELAKCARRKLSSVRPAKKAGRRLASVFEKIEHAQSFPKRVASFFCWSGAWQLTDSLRPAHFAAGQRAAMNSRWAHGELAVSSQWARELYWSRVNIALGWATNFNITIIGTVRYPIVSLQPRINLQGRGKLT